MPASPTNKPGYFTLYTQQVEEEDLLAAFAAQREAFDILIDMIIAEKQSKYAYAPGKWTIKEVLQHLIDAERIFSYRALCFSRREGKKLPVFDEEMYAYYSNANNRKWKDITKEFWTVRSGTECLFKSFTEDMLRQKGEAGPNILTARDVGFITVGHATHHARIIKERYLV